MKKGIFALMFTALILVLAACGGGDEEVDGGDTQEATGATVDIVASNWEFNEENFTAPAGEITFNLTNEEGMHGIEIEGADVSINNEGSATATLEPGEYTIKCSVVCGTGHADMVSTLTVE
ncbi:cytochrome C oxidase subunit II [Halobacillus seohaensis]|uniref:Cytochrome C oxidase subunit II n=1 Tax=Halobacillus seohaensis TaxID=447421 RepID=A0ABW2EJR7_9BACI